MSLIGFNFRISELHAAVGVAQTRKVPAIRLQNLKNKTFLQNHLSKTKGISFSKLGDEQGDSATFLNLLLPNKDIAMRVVDEMNKIGLSGFNYWYTNMYHFINQWDHIKNLNTAAKLAIEVFGPPQDYNNLNLPRSQEVVGRLISFGIRCTWTEEQMIELTTNISACVNKAQQSVIF